MSKKKWRQEDAFARDLAPEPEESEDFEVEVKAEDASAEGHACEHASEHVSEHR